MYYYFKDVPGMCQFPKAAQVVEFYIHDLGHYPPSLGWACDVAVNFIRSGLGAQLVSFRERSFSNVITVVRCCIALQY